MKFNAKKVLSAAAAMAMAATPFCALADTTVDWSAFNMDEETMEEYSDCVANYADLYQDNADGMLTEEEKEDLTEAQRLALDTRAGYILTDLDGDGSPELIVATMADDGYFGKMVLEMFTVKDGEVTRVIVSGERSRYYYAGDNRFAYQGSNGADDSVETTYAFENGQMTDLGTVTDEKDFVQMDLEMIDAASADDESDTADESGVDVSGLCGGWTVDSFQTAADMDEHAAEVFSKATQNLMGVNYDMLALMGTQVVAGTNYCFLTKATLVTPGQESYYAMVYVYEALDGTCEVLDVVPVQIAL